MVKYLANVKRMIRVIVTLKFKIKLSANDGVYNLDFNEDTNFCNKDEEMITPELVGGKITVK